MLLAVFHVENHEDREDFACVIAPPENTYISLQDILATFLYITAFDFVFNLLNLLLLYISHKEILDVPF